MLYPDETMKAWLAGFVDGEGCIRIRHSKRPEARQIHTSYSIEITIANCSRAVLELVRVYYGGSITDKHHPHPKLNWNTAYAWCLIGDKAKDFLLDILPYLKLKRRMAELAIAFQVNLVNRRRGRTAIPDGEDSLRQFAVEVMRALKSPKMYDYDINQEIENLLKGVGK